MIFVTIRAHNAWPLGAVEGLDMMGNVVNVREDELTFTRFELNLKEWQKWEKKVENDKMVEEESV